MSTDSCLNVHLLKFHMVHTLCCVHTLKLTCMLLKSVYTTSPSIAISVLSGSSQSAKLSVSAVRKNPSPPSHILSCFISASLSIPSLWKLKAAARHRPTNIILPRPIHLYSLRSASHLLSLCRDSSSGLVFVSQTWGMDS